MRLPRKLCRRKGSNHLPRERNSQARSYLLLKMRQTLYESIPMAVVLATADLAPSRELVFTLDQTMKGNQHRIGLKYDLLTKNCRNISERLKGDVQTNQRAELTAILRALESVPVKEKMRIFSDSKYSISCVTEWYVNWQKNGWKTKDGLVKNKDLVEAVRAKIDERTEAGTKTYFQWVKGHATEAGNVAADELAVKGARRLA
ncbi:ribonuclease H-like domain-containing protein [Annulohypoxylon stygium]|nr:ribonuclease H-like domain-containing protein [Annulohypoxylon stygium]